MVQVDIPFLLYLPGSHGQQEYLSISSRTRHGGSRRRRRRRRGRGRGRRGRGGEEDEEGEGEEGEEEGREKNEWKDELFSCKALRERDEVGSLHASQTHLSAKHSLKRDNNHPFPRPALTH